MKKNFHDFLNNIQLTSTQRDDAQTKYTGVCKCLDSYYYGGVYNEQHKLLFGSYRTKTNVRPIDYKQDVDVLFKIPLYAYNKYKNNPAGLLQEIRNVLKDKYSTTDRISAWGKVVLVKFSENHHNIELLPALEKEDGTFEIPNTSSDGSWENFNPREQMEAFCESNTQTSNLTRELSQMIKTWVRNTSTLSYKSYLVVEDTLTFLTQIYPTGLGNGHYEEVVRDFFSYMANHLTLDRQYMLHHFQTALNRANKAIQYNKEGKHIEASDEWKKVFGELFPKSEKNEYVKNETNYFTSAPRPWAYR